MLDSQKGYCRAVTALSAVLGGSFYALPATAHGATSERFEATPTVGRNSPPPDLHDNVINIAREHVLAVDTAGAMRHLDAALLLEPQNLRVGAYRAALRSVDTTAQSRSHASGATAADTTSCPDASAECDAEPQAPRRSTTSRYGWTGELSAGATYDSDAVNSVSHVFDNPANTAGRGGGLSFIGAARLQGRTAAGSGWAYGGASLTTKNSLTGPQANYQVGELRAGYGRRAGGGTVTLGGIVRHGRFADAPYLTQYGGQLGVTFAPVRFGRLSVQVEAMRQDYARTTPILSRNGWRFDLATTLRVNTGNKNTVVVGIGLEKKTAVTRTEGYQGARLLANIRIPLATDGTYVNLTSTARYSDYDDNGPIKGRSELRFFNRAAIGIPIGPKGLSIEAAVSHTATNYNRASLLNNYSSSGGEARLVWKFGQ